MEYIIQNDFLTVTISDWGAEIISVKDDSDTEYIWHGDPSVWKRHAPILFPYVGRLKDDSLNLSGSLYEGLSQHGFARDSKFEAKEVTPSSITFRLTSDMIQSPYPFEFTLEVRYSLQGEELLTDYRVENMGLRTMYFSLGAHPAFICPRDPNRRFEDYVLKFDQAETISTIRLVDGLRSYREKFILGYDTVRLSRDIFEKDALIFDEVISDGITLQTNTGNKVVTVSNLKKWPFLGVWTKSTEDATFICIEPWHGIADSVQGEFFEKKPGVIDLTSGSSWENSLCFTFHTTLLNSIYS
jgi:galactose mutarotase-like enzyme